MDGAFFQMAPAVPSNLYAYVEGNPLVTQTLLDWRQFCVLYSERERNLV